MKRLAYYRFRAALTLVMWGYRLLPKTKSLAGQPTLLFPDLDSYDEGYGLTDIRVKSLEVEFEVKERA